MSVLHGGILQYLYLHRRAGKHPAYDIHMRADLVSISNAYARSFLAVHISISEEGSRYTSIANLSRYCALTVHYAWIAERSQV